MTDSSDWQQVPQKRHRHRQDTSRRDNRSSQQKPSTTTHQIPVKREVRDASRSQRYPRDIRDRRHERPPRTYPVPNLVNETIYLNEKEKDLYDKLNESGVKYIPYQSLDMINQRRKELADGVPEDEQRVTVRFAKEADINEYKKNKAAFEQIKKDTEYRFDLKNGQYDLPSPIDIFKMQANVMSTDPGKASTRPYLYQTDPQVREHVKRVNEVVARIDKDIGNPVDSKRNIIFIPYLPGVPIGNIETHSQYKNVSICNNREFVSKLKDLFPDKYIRGTILRDIGWNMELYDQLTDDDLDTIVERQKKDLYGLTKKDIAEYLVAKNKALKKEVEESENSKYSPKSNCKDIFDKMIETLSDSSVIDADMSSVNRELRDCWARSLEFQELINHKIGMDLEPKNSTYDAIYKICSKTDMIFSPWDRVSKPTFYDCDRILDTIKDPHLKNKLGEILKNANDKYPNPYTDENLNMTPYVQYPYDVSSFGEYYMPEWYGKIIDDKLDEAFNKRPIILGISPTNRTLSNCSLIARGNPFFKIVLNISDISYNITQNQAIISCLLNRTDLIFPIHIYLPEINSISIYSPFVSSEPILLGSFLIRASGKRFANKTRYYQIFVYFDTKKKMLKLTNFRANELVPGTIMEHIRIVYRELNTLMYSEQDLGIKLYWYKVKNDPDRYLISHLNITEIKKEYRQRYDSMFKKNGVDVEEIINALIPCRIRKDRNKRFVIEPI